VCEGRRRPERCRACGARELLPPRSDCGEQPTVQGCSPAARRDDSGWASPATLTCPDGPNSVSKAKPTLPAGIEMA
jgi:hypothetical protein